MKKSIYLLILFLTISSLTDAEKPAFLGYKLSEISSSSYEEGRVYGTHVILDSAQGCFAFYYNGAMMGIPIYYRQIKGVECVKHSNISSTGELYYGKSTDGTFFVEKEFYGYLNGLPQGIILFGIPEEYYEEVLQRIESLPNLPIELL